jgi:hypothetical protein
MRILSFLGPVALLSVASACSSGGSSTSDASTCDASTCTPLATELTQAGAGAGACVNPAPQFAARCAALAACEKQCGL